MLLTATGSSIPSTDYIFVSYPHLSDSMNISLTKKKQFLAILALWL